MKTILAALLLAWYVTVHAQSTFVQYRTTNFIFKSAANYVATTNITFTNNQVARIVNLNLGPQITGVGLTLQYSGDTNVFLYTSIANLINLPILGPCSVNMFVTNATATGIAFVTAQFDNANLEPSAIGLVQPASKTATVALQTSTDLATWQTVAASNYPSANLNRFFRVSLTNSP